METPTQVVTSVPSTVPTAIPNANEVSTAFQQLILDSVSQMKGAVEKGVEFAQAQAPDIIHQMLIWFMTMSAIKFVLRFVVLYGVYRGLKFAAEVSADGDVESASGIFVISVMVGLATLTTFTAASTFDWLQIWIAPKIFLIEYAAELVKSHH